MFPIRIRTLLTATALLASPWAASLAQYEDHCGPFCEGASDLRYFEPVDLDLDCMPVDRSCGYIFGYDKLYWAFTGDRTTIGAPGVTDLAEEIYPRQPQDDSAPILNQLPPGLQPQPYTIINGIQDAPPYAGFGWGDRYEFGYFKDQIAYTVGVLDGPSYTTSEVYGFVPLDLGNDGIDIDGDGVIDFNEGTNITGFGPPPPGQSQNPNPLEILLAPTLNGFGSVHVNFNTPEGFMLGYRDYFDDIVGDLNADDTLDGGLITVVGPDGTLILYDNIADDINGNGGNFLFLLAPDPANPGEFLVVAIARDFGDLHEFNFRFNTLQVRNHTETDGIELMKTHTLNNRHMKAKHQNSQFSFGYGVRYFRMNDDFRFDGLTDIAGRVFTITQSENSIVGPQVRVKAARQVGKWNTSIDTRFMFGYNIQNIDQTNGFGDDAMPGGLNNLLYLQPTYSRYGKRSDDFTPFIEMRAEVKYQLTRSLALKGGFNATYVDNISRAAQLVQYNAPDFGIGQTGEQNIFISGLTFGAEFVH
ncbi:hypothetical protein Pla123a_15010 [Posidoniimonas polymericola]|uniref:FG-GAP repeat protein n=1 Tax=Posidoniimonas polymericola TaxID=2528002 RepID=A0A5C5YS12_9BACT|nr:BBP7 family outer membrane beta-barrel protein [Posidoniimonas polymericola]TWT77705.1 hypothetical protein Pla123a_15010 [Posidoniimonas polymericola]